MSDEKNPLVEIDKKLRNLEEESKKYPPGTTEWLRLEELHAQLMDVRSLIVNDMKRVLDELDAISQKGKTFPGEKFVTLEHVKAIVTGIKTEYV